MDTEKKEPVNISQLLRNVYELKLIQAQATKLIVLIDRDIKRLQRDGEAGVTTESKATLNYFRGKIGKKVRIVNPRKGEPDVGIITEVGKLYITVQLTPELSRKRQAKNLRILDYEDHPY